MVSFLLKILVLLINSVLLITAGQIDAWDIELDYNNAGFMSELTIPFRL